MARKISRWLHTEHARQRDTRQREAPQRGASQRGASQRGASQRVTPPRLSTLQQSILYWLQHELHRRQRAGDLVRVPYTELVRVIDADKASITREVRSLLHKELLGMSLPTGEWVRYLVLTDKGAEYAKTLSGNVQRLRRRR